MKILHTADIHLREKDDERWRALEEILDLGKSENVDVLTISGDLFDKDTDAEKLRTAIRELFSGNGFTILLLPGNHDAGSFREELYFGEDVELLNTLPQRSTAHDKENLIEMEGVRFCGLPFSEELEGEDLVKKIKSLSELFGNDKTNVLLYHGELLDSFFSAEDFGGEGEKRYMPVHLSAFKGTGVDYVLAGHFHSNSDVWKIDDSSYFVYPGSPVSITRRETGVRHAVLIEDGNPPRNIPLYTTHYREVNVEIDPLENKDPLEKISEALEQAEENENVLLSVSGYIAGEGTGAAENTQHGKAKTGETKLREDIDQLLQGKQVLLSSYRVRDIGTILNDELFDIFLRKLEESGVDEHEYNRRRELAIRAFMGT